MKLKTAVLALAFGLGLLCAPLLSAAPGLAYLDITNVFGADQDLNSHKLLHVTTPTVSTDGANKSYVDGLVTGGVYAAVENVANVTATHGVFTTITWSTDINDPAGMHDTSSNTSRFTVPTGDGGTYLIGCSIFITSASSETAQYILRPEVNGAVIDGGLTVLFGPGNGANMGLNGSTQVRLSAGDYVEWQVFTGAASDKSILALASPNYYNPRAWIVRVSQ